MAMNNKTMPSKQETPYDLLNKKNLNDLLLSAFEQHQSGSLEKAKDLYTSILSHHPDHPDVLHLLGVICYQNGDMDAAENFIKKADKINPHVPEYKCNLGNILSKLGRHEEAISCYRDALKLNPDFTEAYNNLGVSLRCTSKIQEAVDCYKKALEIKPDHESAHNNLGNIFRESGEIDQALFHYQQAIRLNPHYVEAYINLGKTFRDKGDYDNAIACFRKTIEIKNDYADAYHLLGITYHETGSFNDACECLCKELEIRPENPHANNSLGIALQHAGKPEGAISYYQKAIEIDPDFAEAYSNLGIALHHTGRPEEAILSYKKAIALNSEFAKAYNNLGITLLEMHKTEEAIESFEQALHIQPDFAEAYNNLGIALQVVKRQEDAHTTFQKALAVKPAFVDAHINSGNTFRDQFQFAEALSCYHKALEINPHNIDALNNTAYIFSIQGKVKESIHFYQKALEIDPDHATTHSNLLFSLHYQDSIDFQELSEQHKRWGEKVARTLTMDMSPHANDKTPGRKLRIGYVSPDFRKHSVAYFIEPILASHDESAFEVFCYSNVAVPDETTEHIQSLVKTWHDITLLKNKQVEDMIRDDKIDILIDLAGHSSKNRLSLFALGPAPVQVTYLGYPNTTGLLNMHYRITDALADPAGKTDHLFTEKLLRLPRGFLCFRPPLETPEVAQPPIMKSGNVTFGSFNNRAKITPRVVKVWSEILKRLPGSRMVLKSEVLTDPETQQSLLDIFVQNGVSPDRVGFYGSIPNQYDHLALYNSIDIALDTFPYNGTTTTCEALWMGVPVIVLKGDAHMSRVGVSLLTNAGMEEFIADTPEDYVKKAVGLANDQDGLLRLRNKQRNIMADSPLMDAQVFTQYLEKEYRKIWGQWCTMNNERTIDKINCFTGERAMPLATNMDMAVMQEHWARYNHVLPLCTGKRVLDVACGSGYGSDLLAQSAKGVTGGDISHDAISYCKAHYHRPNLSFGVMDIRKLPFSDNSFDMVVSFETLEHILEGDLFLKEVCRVLSDKGSLAISTPLGGPCGNPYHVAYYQKGNFEKYLLDYFQEVNVNFQRGNKLYPSSNSLDDSSTFTGEYALAVCHYPKKGFDKLTSIIILAHNQLECTKKCIESIEQNTPERHELILVDNGSTDGTTEFLQTYAHNHNHVRLILNESNLGFAAGNNLGIEQSKGKYIMFLNNDVVVTEGWLGKLTDILNRYPDFGMVGPMSNSVSGPQLVMDVPYGEDLAKMKEFAATYSRDHAGEISQVLRLVGFCMLVRKEVLDLIGGFDNNYMSGNFEDDDLCLRSFLVGHKHVIAGDAFVHHYGSMTFKGSSIDYEKTMENNKKYFFSKWGHLIDKTDSGYEVNISHQKLDAYVDEILKWGEEQYEQGKYKQSVLLFQRVLQIQPNNSRAINNLGVVMWQTGNIPSAINIFLNTLNKNREDVDAFDNLVASLQASDRYDLVDRTVLERLRPIYGTTEKFAQLTQKIPLEEKDIEKTHGRLTQLDESCLRININGGIQVCVPPSIQLMTPYILVEQEDWFEDEIYYIRKFLQPGMNVIDIGANYGLYTLTASKLVGPAGKIWAFEPTSSTAAFLKKSISANHMTNIELVQAGLSDKKCTAKLALNPDSELNSITTQPNSGEEYETVDILSLDECEDLYGWDNIDFIKLDAEGQEHNIIMGGKHFLATRSPLIMFELKHGDKINIELLSDFSTLGYRLYHLIPDLNILVPIDLNKSFDPYQLNLFCCKEDRAKILEEKGLLITRFSLPNPISDDSLWQQELQHMPFFKLLMGSWTSTGKDNAIAGWDHYKNALNYFIMAHDETKTPHSRYASLRQTLKELSSALENEKNICRLLTYTRVLSELGQRQDSLNTAEIILGLSTSEQALALTEPFLSPSKRFDQINPSDISTWVIASLLEHWEKTRAFSSFYSGKSSLNNLEVMKQLGCQTPEMERRRQLIRIRFGLQDRPIPHPLLSTKARDNLNPGFWTPDVKADVKT